MCTTDSGLWRWVWMWNETKTCGIKIKILEVSGCGNYSRWEDARGGYRTTGWVVWGDSLEKQL